MGLFLKQSTAVDVIVGPFIDKTDGNTAETALTVTQAEVRLSKNGGNMAQKNEATALAHDELGYYLCKFDATDTNTLGILQLMIHESADALPVYHEYMVVTANVWDTLCSTDLFQTDLTQIGGVAQSATDLKDLADTGYDPSTHKVQGVVLVDTTTTNTDMVDVSDLATILTDTNELQTDWTNGGRLDLLMDAVKAKTDNLPADPADESNIIAEINANETKIDTLQTDVTAIKGYVDTEVAAIKAVTDTLSLAAIADAVHDEVTEGTTTLRQAVRLLLSHHAGKSSGGGTNTLVYRDVGDTKDRLTYTVDADGNRSAVVRDGS